MKTFLPITALSLAVTLAAGTALADGKTGGFTGPDNIPLVTAAEAAGLADETMIKLQGFIVRALGDEKYEFRDNSGTITVEIDGDDWGGVQATPDVKVELLVEVDRDFRRVEFDAESVRLVP